MNRFFVKLSLFLLVFSTCFSQGFKTDGTKLLDPMGGVFIIRGINTPHIWYLNKSLKSLEAISNTGANCNRIVWETKGKPKDLEKAIQKTIQYGMVPMVELHDATGAKSTEKLMEMVAYYAREDVKAVLKKYEKYLLINIANEWGDHTTDAEYWKEAYKIAILAMRSAGYNYTLVIDAPGWGQDISPIIQYGRYLMDSDPENNLLFSIHMYGSWNDAAKIDRKLQKVFDLSLPLIVGEFGYNYNQGQNNLSCEVDHIAIMRKCSELGYGYIPWSWTGNNLENAWLDMSPDWKTLTWWGKEVVEGEYGIRRTSRKAFVNN